MKPATAFKCHRAYRHMVAACLPHPSARRPPPPRPSRTRHRHTHVWQGPKNHKVKCGRSQLPHTANTTDRGKLQIYSSRRLVVTRLVRLDLSHGLKPGTSRGVYSLSTIRLHSSVYTPCVVLSLGALLLLQLLSVFVCSATQHTRAVPAAAHRRPYMPAGALGPCLRGGGGGGGGWIVTSCRLKRH